MSNQGNLPLMPIKAKPYQHQQAAFEFACGLFGLSGSEMLSKGVALLMEMGTGKTITGIAITGALFLNGRIHKVLVVAPLSIIGVWDEEFLKFADYDYTLAVLSGTGVKKADTLRHMCGASLQVAVVNYESAWRMEKEILTWKPDLVIADEGHKLKTYNIAASKPVYTLEHLGDKLMKAENFALALDEIVWLITLLANQYILIHNLKNTENRRELITEEYVELMTSPFELAGYKEAILNAMFKGTKRYVESEEPPTKNR